LRVLRFGLLAWAISCWRRFLRRLMRR
jgi:hypothetical protein